MVGIGPLQEMPSSYASRYPQTTAEGKTFVLYSFFSFFFPFSSINMNCSTYRVKY